MGGEGARGRRAQAAGCAALVRIGEEWRAHPQAAAVGCLPLIEIERIGEAPPEPLPAAGRPLAGLRVLDLTRVLAGPTCARTLAEHGAEVLKIAAPHLPAQRDMDIDTGLGKRSAFLDLRREADAATLAALVRDGRADVFAQGYRPGTLAGRGFGAEALARLRPGIVAVELSAWGRLGPWSQRRGFDTIVQCASGMAMIEGAGTPRLMPVSAIDYVSGYLMAFGAMAALLRRAREGGSWRVRVSLARTGQWIGERGLLDAAAVVATPKEMPEAEIARFSAETESVFGRIRHLAPVARMAETPPRWARPPVPLGHDRGGLAAALAGSRRNGKNLPRPCCKRDTTIAAPILARPTTRKICGTLSPDFSSTALIAPEATMKMRVHHVVGGDHPRAVAHLAARLEQRIERHREETAAERDQEEIRQQPPMGGLDRETRRRRSARPRRRPCAPLAP